jgi:hypothetical protein
MQHFKFQIPSRDNSTRGCSFRVLTGLVGAGRRAKGGSGGLAPEEPALVTTLVATRERWSNRRDAMVVLEKGKQATNVVLNLWVTLLECTVVEQVGLPSTGRHFLAQSDFFSISRNSCGRTWNR